MFFLIIQQYSFNFLNLHFMSFAIVWKIMAAKQTRIGWFAWLSEFQFNMNINTYHVVRSP